MFTETFPVRFDECGPNKQSTMRTVASMIQECACNHAQGIWGRAQSMPADMKMANLAWVCTRLHIDVLQYPLWGDQVEVRTWFEAQGRIAARRDWEMSDVTDGSSEKVIARATSLDRVQPRETQARAHPSIRAGRVPSRKPCPTRS